MDAHFTIKEMFINENNILCAVLESHYEDEPWLKNQSVVFCIDDEWLVRTISGECSKIIHPVISDLQKKQREFLNIKPIQKTLF